jgi:SAM-dependent methyltransferase
MNDYYQKRLSAKRLELVYKLAPPRIKQYLEAEIAFARTMIKAKDTVLELGCGYGRVVENLVGNTGFFMGIDTAFDSLQVAAQRFSKRSNLAFSQMNAAKLGFKAQIFDLTICIQNGISAFHISPDILVNESIRVTKKSGRVLFSSYSAEIWGSRLEWFRRQSEQGLIGEIDENATGDGEIVCKDGFTATTFGPEDFKSLCSRYGMSYQIHEVDRSSVFCEIFLL